MSSSRFDQNLRYNLARWRAVAGRQHESTDEKLQVAEALVQLGVWMSSRPGFPSPPQMTLKPWRAVGHHVSAAPKFAFWPRCADADIDRAWEALKLAQNPRIHVFLATSAIHREFKLKMTPDEIVSRAVAGVQRAKAYCGTIVEFSPGRRGANRVGLLVPSGGSGYRRGGLTRSISPITVGYAVPAQIGHVIKSLVNRVPNVDQATISIHCHNDLGLAVANSLGRHRKRSRASRMHESTASANGPAIARFEEIVMALRTRSDYSGATRGSSANVWYPPATWFRKLLACTCKGTKRLSVGMRSPMKLGIHQDGIAQGTSHV
jgi:2-isopropylmalate synthase